MECRGCLGICSSVSPGAVRRNPCHSGLTGPYGLCRKALDEVQQQRVEASLVHEMESGHSDKA